MKKPKKPKPVNALEIGMNLVQSGVIASPVSHLDFSLSGYVSFRLLLRRVFMANHPEGLCALFSEDGGASFANAEADYHYSMMVNDASEMNVEHADDFSMPINTVGSGEPHFADIDIEPGEGDEPNDIWIMPFIRSAVVTHASSFPGEQRIVSRFQNYNTRQTHLRIKGADGGNIASGRWYLYGV